MTVCTADMIPRGRGSSSNRGGYNLTPYRGGRGRGKEPEILAQYGNKRLIAMDLSGERDYQEYLAFKKKNATSTSEIVNDENIPSFASIVGNEESDQNHDHATYREGKIQEVILLLEEDDYKWLDEPWTLMKRYMEEESYPQRMYKSRLYYENILSYNGCEIQHFSNLQSEVYNFSKIIIKKVIPVRDWGMSPLKTKEFCYSQNKNPIKYNYWDYMDAFSKVLLYENPKCKHSWFIKICSEVYKNDLPVWFIKWWQMFGTTEDILPKSLKEKYSKWVKISPRVLEYQDKEFNIEGLYSLLFFIEFSIPYIWKWMPVYGHTDDIIPCLKRHNFSRFWDKMVKIDPKTKKFFGEDTIEYMDRQIKLYEEQKQKKKDSSFQYIMDKIRVKAVSSKEDIINAYLEQMKKDLQNFEDETMSHNSVKTDVSMATSSQNIFQDSQDIEEPNVDDIFETVKHFIAEKFITTTEEKGESSHSPTQDGGNS